MRTVFSILLSAIALIAAPIAHARADDTPACTSPSTLTAGFRLKYLAASLKETAPTTILVLNSSATTGAARKQGDDNKAARSFPSYIEESLSARYPDGRVKVVIRHEPRRTAEDIIGVLPDILAKVKPSLVIWQIGTYDAIRGADLDGFASAASLGINLAHAAGADIILMSPQYSPRTDFAFDVAPYAATLRWVARSNNVSLFDRYALMRFWDEDGIFDVDSLRPGPALFNNVHRCIGRLLLKMIRDGVDIKTSESR